MRTILLLGALLLTAALPAASAGATTLFEDARGDVGPWPAMVVGVGLPGPAWADLLSASVAPGADGGVDLRILVAEVPSPLPPDAVWAVGGKVAGSGSFWAVAYVHLVTGPGETHAGAAVCTFESSGKYGPEGEPTCEDVPAEVVAGPPGGFLFRVPPHLAVAALQDPGGVVLVEPGSTAWPLALAHATGLTVLDVGWNEGTIELPLAQKAVETASAVARVEAERPVPAPGVLLAGLAGGATALLRRRA